VYAAEQTECTKEFTVSGGRAVLEFRGVDVLVAHFREIRVRLVLTAAAA
jgi:hypothetical protein